MVQRHVSSWDFYFILNELPEIIDINDDDIYRDNGVNVIENSNKTKVDNIRKKTLFELFKDLYCRNRLGKYLNVKLKLIGSIVKP